MRTTKLNQQHWALRINPGPVVGGFTSRQAGNLRFHSADQHGVATARHTVLAELGVVSFPLVETQQVHGDNVFVVTLSSLQKIRKPDGRYVAPASDALITTMSEVTLSLYYADCVPILLWLPRGRGIGLVHAGWRGSLQNVAGKTDSALCRLTNTSPTELHAILGPSICRDCYEVGPEVAEQAAILPDAEDFLRREDQHWHLDLKALNSWLLVEAGVDPERVEVSSLCTRCRPDLFFSYRAEGPGCGEMGAFIAIL